MIHVFTILTIILTVLSTCVTVQAQGGMTSLIRKASTPESVVGFLIEASFVSSPDVLRRLHSYSNFSPSEIQTMTRLSRALSAEAIRRQSELPPETLRMIDRDSEFSDSMMRILEKRSEHRNGSPVQAVSPAFEAFVSRHSEPSAVELRQLLRAMDSDEFQAFLSRNSTTKDPSLIRNRSVASQLELRIFLGRSTD